MLDQLSCPNHYFVHRDFHVSNLINFQNKVGIIDSQDALLGNPTYDLMSLIDDVRIKTSLQLKKKIFSYYLAKTKIAHGRRVFCLKKEEKTIITLKDLDKGLERFLDNSEVKERKNDISKQILKHMYM